MSTVIGLQFNEKNEPIRKEENINFEEECAKLKKTVSSTNKKIKELEKELAEKDKKLEELEAKETVDAK